MSVEARPDPHDRTTLQPDDEATSKPSTSVDDSSGTSTEPPRPADGGDGPQAHAPEPEITGRPRGPADTSRLRTIDPPGEEERTAVESTSPSTRLDSAVADEAVRSTEAATGFDRPAAQDDGHIAPGDSRPDAEAESIRERILAEADARAERHVGEVCATYGVESPEQIMAVRKAMNIIAETAAPFAVEGARRILESVRGKIEKWPDAVVAITCRDGRTLGMAIAELDPRFYEAHCRPVHLSRRCMENVLQNKEEETGQKFAEIEEMRDRTMIDPEEVPGAALRTQRHLLSSGLPITTPGAHIIFVDSGARGTIQEQVSAAWPKANYSSEFLHHIEFEHDPNKGTKTGHFLHISSDSVHPADPDDPARIFAEKPPGVVFEDLMHGPMASTVGHDERGNPVYAAERSSADQIVPLVIRPEYDDSNVRMAIMDVAQRAVSNRARTAADLADAGLDYRQDLIEEARAYIRKVRSWVDGDDTGDPAFNALADSFVRREDKNLVPRLRTATRDFDEAASIAVWRDYRQLPLADKRRYVEHHERTALSPGSAAPEGPSDG